jgi:hypothetical protein
MAGNEASSVAAPLERLLAAGKDSALLRFGIGNAYLKAGDAPRAAEHRHALAFDPGYRRREAAGAGARRAGRTTGALVAHRDAFRCRKERDKQAMKRNAGVRTPVAKQKGWSRVRDAAPQYGAARARFKQANSPSRLLRSAPHERSVSAEAAMTRYEKLRHLVIGAPLDPLSQTTRQHIALAAFLAWVGLGADGLSSSAYGPEEAFRALGAHTHLGLYMAVATAATVFIISLAYNQVIELFPTGGGGYRVATSLIGPRAGLVSGAALIVDYVLTIAISVASGVDALFSLLPAPAGTFKLGTELVLVALLLVLNLRGMKESIRILLPIFLGFFITHAFLISYGIPAIRRLVLVKSDALAETAARARHRLGGGAVAVPARIRSAAAPTRESKPCRTTCTR